MPSSEVQMYSSIYSHQISWPCPPVTNVPCPVEFFCFLFVLLMLMQLIQGMAIHEGRRLGKSSLNATLISRRALHWWSSNATRIYQCFLLHDNFLCTHMELINYHKMMFQSPNHRGELTLLLVCMLWVNCFTCAAYVCVDKFFMYVIW